MTASGATSVTSAGTVENLRTMAKRLRRHALRCTNKAGSGHPTSAMSCAELVSGLFFSFLRLDLTQPQNPFNDRFILSKGHATPVLWAVLAEAGAGTVEELVESYRRFGSPLEGHPTPRHPFVDVGTGALGQGLSIGVGMALRSRLNKIDNRIYVLLGDGETAEGAVWEAAAIAAHYKLGNLIAIVDINRLGQTEATMYGHDVDEYTKKFQAFGWRSRTIDGHDMDAVLAALQEAIDYRQGPFVILAKTFKGKGVSFLEDKNGRHGKPVTGEEFEKALGEIGEAELTEPLGIAAPNISAPAKKYEAKAVTISMESPSYEAGDQVATRKAYAVGLTKLAKVDSDVVVLDGDLKNSTYTELFLEQFPDRFFECYIAEQNMVGMAMGLSALGKRPFCSTFASFLTRAHDQIRMAAISGSNIKYAGSHAGVSVGEDGPSQMGLEDIAMFRATPGSTVLYPADAVSTERLVGLAAQNKGATYLRLTRGPTAILYGPNDSFSIGGSKVLKFSTEDKVTIFAAGITVHEALTASEILAKDGVAARLIDVYSIKPIDEATVLKAARETGFVITVEDHYPEGGLGDAILNVLAGEKVKIRKLAVNAIPCSGDPKTLMDHFGISSSNIVTAARQGDVYGSGTFET